MIRAFVGIPLPDETVRALGAAQVGLPSGRPVAPENFHVTIAFLGERPEPQVEDVHLALERIRARRFSLWVRGMGLFGSDNHKVLYAVIDPEPALGQLREKVMQAARGAGLRLPRERYTPHVTLARFNAGLRGEAAQEMRDFAARGAGLRAGPVEVEEFVLYRSTLGRKGPIYEELAVYPLNGG